MKSVFVDTSGFYAFIAADDPHHVQARQIFQGARDQGWMLLTTSYVVHECWAVIQGRLGWAALDAWRDGLLPDCEIVWIDAALQGLGEARCRQARQRRLSLTDCTSFEVMRQRHIHEAIAWDEHFAREGFILPEEMNS